MTSQYQSFSEIIREAAKRFLVDESMSKNAASQHLIWAGEPGREKWPSPHHLKSGHSIITQVGTADGCPLFASSARLSGRFHNSAPNGAQVNR